MLCHPQESKKLQNKHWEHIQYKEMKDKSAVHIFPDFWGAICDKNSYISFYEMKSAHFRDICFV